MDVPFHAKCNSNVLYIDILEIMDLYDFRTSEIVFHTVISCHDPQRIQK